MVCSFKSLKVPKWGNLGVICVAGKLTVSEITYLQDSAQDPAREFIAPPRPPEARAHVHWINALSLNSFFSPKRPLLKVLG